MQRAFIAAALGSALLVSACGGNDAASPVVGANCADVYYEGEGSPNVLIVSDFPRRGPERREITTPMTEAIKLALRRRAFRGELGGWGISPATTPWVTTSTRPRTWRTRTSSAWSGRSTPAAR